MNLKELWVRWRGRRLKPGQKCAMSGQYRNSHTLKQATCTKGEPMPPAPAGTFWVLTDPTRHKG
jgi:hypothetical protein